MGVFSDESAVPERRPKALAITILIVGALVAIVGVFLAFHLRDATMQSAEMLQSGVTLDGSLDALPAYRAKYFWLGIAVASVVAGFIAFLGAALRLLIRR